MDGLGYDLTVDMFLISISQYSTSTVSASPEMESVEPMLVCGFPKMVAPNNHGFSH